MNFNVTREQWIDRFVIRMANLVVGAEPASFVSIAEALWPMRGQVAPEEAADAEHAARRKISDPFESTGRFEKTERIPVERIEAAGEYVRDDGEWVARCTARVLELDPIIKADEARRSVSDLVGLERWRLMRPESAAEQLYTPIRPRPE